MIGFGWNSRELNWIGSARYFDRLLYDIRYGIVLCTDTPNTGPVVASVLFSTSYVQGLCLLAPMKVAYLDTINPSGYATGASPCCYLLVDEFRHNENVLLIGYDDGNIVYIPQNFSKKNQFAVLGHYEEEGVGRRESENSGGGNFHKSAITCLMQWRDKSLHESAPRGLLFSGSMDRSIKIWNVNASNPAKNLIQTLSGHGAAIISVVDCKDGTIVSCSKDGNIRMWAPQKKREMMLNPFFEVVCNIYMRLSEGNWLTCLCDTSSGGPSVYLGDSEGSVTLYKKAFARSDSDGAAAPLMAKHKHFEYIHHRCIYSIHLLEEERYLVTLSFDALCKVSDSKVGHTMYSIENPSKSMYTGVLWLPHKQDLCLVDEMGNLDVFRVSSERLVHREELARPPLRYQEEEILTAHRHQMLSKMCLFRHLTTRDVFIVLKHSFSGPHELAVYSLSEDAARSDFVGHGDKVVGMVLPAETQGCNSSIDTPPEVTASASSSSAIALTTVSREESVFFSASSDMTIRCWDEYDAKENYQFRMKSGVGEVTVLAGLWALNLVATGHESGHVCLWHADSGSRLTSYALKFSVTALTEGKKAQKHVLLAADYSGQMAVFSLSLLSSSLSDLPLDSMCRSFHDVEEPGVLCAAYHKLSRCYFTGGHDSTLRCFFLGSESARKHLGHADAINALRCTENYMLSGDETGEIRIWKLERVVKQHTSLNFPNVTIMCKFFPNESINRSDVPCLHALSFLESNKGCNLFLLLGGQCGRSVLSKISIQRRNTRHTPNRGSVHARGSTSRNSSLAATAAVKEEEEEEEDGAAVGYVSDDEECVVTNEHKIYLKHHQDIYISINAEGAFSHPEHNATSAEMAFYTDDDQEEDQQSIGIIQRESQNIRFVYVGTDKGVILRFKL